MNVSRVIGEDDGSSEGGRVVRMYVAMNQGITMNEMQGKKIYSICQ